MHGRHGHDVDDGDDLRWWCESKLRGEESSRPRGRHVRTAEGAAAAAERAAHARHHRAPRLADDAHALHAIRGAALHARHARHARAGVPRRRRHGLHVPKSDRLRRLRGPLARRAAAAVPGLRRRKPRADEHRAAADAAAQRSFPRRARAADVDLLRAAPPRCGPAAADRTAHRRVCLVAAARAAVHARATGHGRLPDGAARRPRADGGQRDHQRRAAAAAAAAHPAGAARRWPRLHRRADRHHAARRHLLHDQLLPRAVLAAAQPLRRRVATLAAVAAGADGMGRGAAPRAAGVHHDVERVVWMGGEPLPRRHAVRLRRGGRRRRGRLRARRGVPDPLESDGHLLLRPLWLLAGAVDAHRQRDGRGPLARRTADRRHRRHVCRVARDARRRRARRRPPPRRRALRRRRRRHRAPARARRSRAARRRGLRRPRLDWAVLRAPDDLRARRAAPPPRRAQLCQLLGRGDPDRRGDRDARRPRAARAVARPRPGDAPPGLRRPHLHRLPRLAGGRRARRQAGARRLGGRPARPEGTARRRWRRRRRRVATRRCEL